MESVEGVRCGECGKCEGVESVRVLGGTHPLPGLDFEVVVRGARVFTTNWRWFFQRLAD